MQEFDTSETVATLGLSLFVLYVLLILQSAVKFTDTT